MKNLNKGYVFFNYIEIVDDLGKTSRHIQDICFSDDLGYFEFTDLEKSHGGLSFYTMGRLREAISYILSYCNTNNISTLYIYSDGEHPIDGCSGVLLNYINEHISNIYIPLDYISEPLFNSGDNKTKMIHYKDLVSAVLEGTAFETHILLCQRLKKVISILRKDYGLDIIYSMNNIERFKDEKLIDYLEKYSDIEKQLKYVSK